MEVIRLRNPPQAGSLSQRFDCPAVAYSITKETAAKSS